MTYQEYTQLLSQLPEQIRKEYGFNEPFDYSQYKCVHTDEYDYYPELNCCVIDNIPIVWESNNPWVTPENPEILKGFKELTHDHTNNPCAFINVNTDNKLTCQIMNYAHPMTKNIIQKKNYQTISFAEGPICYIPTKIDLTKDKIATLIAKCLFTAKKYNTIYIFPDKTTPVSEWKTGIHTGGTSHE